ncbi:conserved hypothetical protein [Tenacibaculum sp. 190524A02b]|uniref:Uncharacterized protein n=1 Tax=Tenacibaculum vairaonense TaxID=3137860 RepID=A0ABP1FHV4_9FLAO
MSFDSREHPWSNLEVAIDGSIITRIRGIKFSVKKEKELLQAKGENPHEIVSGNKTYEGEVTLLGSQLDKLQELLEPDQDLTDAPPFDIVVSLSPKRAGQKMVNFTLQQVEWLEDVREFKQGDKFQEYTIPILFLGRKVGK